MKYTRHFIVAALVLAAPFAASAAQYGYCTDITSRNYIFRIGSSETQGMAIRLDSGKLQALKGETIKGVSVVFGSRNTTDNKATFFISPGFDATPITTQEVTVSSAIKWLEYAFDTPYTITGEEGELVIGYTADINTKSSLLTADHTMDSEGCSYVYGDGAWSDTKGMGVGNVSLRILTDNEHDHTDLMLKRVAVDGYFKSGDSTQFDGQVFNFGTQVINSFDLALTIGDEPTVTQSFTGLNLAQGEVMDLQMPEFAANSQGSLPLTIEIRNVNSTVDVDPTDNVYASQLFYYPQDMERSILLEGFTGQTCSNCPGGHSTIHTFLQNVSTPVIEVNHHAGYQPDFLTMDADLDYTYFYGSTNTFAPAIMVNRTMVPTVGSVPVMNTTNGNLTSAFDYVQSMQPYASLSIESTYDPTTREVKLTVRGLTHNDMPAACNILNVMLVQDGIKGLQLPLGTDYVHNGVMRTVLTGNSWGMALDNDMCKAGGTMEWSKTFTLEETIFSDAYNWDKLSADERLVYSTVTNPDDMRLVAYVAAYSADDVNGHIVYNAVETKLGNSYTQGGMASVRPTIADSTSDIDIRVVDGRIVAIGDYDSMQVYSIAGKQVNHLAELQAGIYVVRVAHAGNVTTKKIMISNR